MYKTKYSEQYLASKKRWREGPKYKEWVESGARMLIAAKGRAKNSNLDFNIDITDIIIPEYCPILGIKLEFHKNKVQKNSPVLDRIDNGKGYVKENVAVISHRANMLKNNMTEEIWQNLGKYANWNKEPDLEKFFK